MLALFGPLELSAQEYGVNKGYKDIRGVLNWDLQRELEQ